MNVNHTMFLPPIQTTPLMPLISPQLPSTTSPPTPTALVGWYLFLVHVKVTGPVFA